MRTQTFHFLSEILNNHEKDSEFFPIRNELILLLNEIFFESKQFPSLQSNI
jgi:hypothetical protein